MNWMLEAWFMSIGILGTFLMLAAVIFFGFAWVHYKATFGKGKDRRIERE